MNSGIEPLTKYTRLSEVLVLFSIEVSGTKVRHFLSTLEDPDDGAVSISPTNWAAKMTLLTVFP